jgi:hypothetical protein
MDVCDSLPKCNYGTYIAATIENEDTKATAKGECWLSQYTHEKLVKCGLPCIGFGRPDAVAKTPADTPADCTRGKVWTVCGSNCVKTCVNKDPMCSFQCVKRCQCPPSQPFWDEFAGRCTAADKCPTKVEGCCTALTAKCESCRRDMPIGAFCKGHDFPGCPKPDPESCMCDPVSAKPSKFVACHQVSTCAVIDPSAVIDRDLYVY